MLLGMFNLLAVVAATLNLTFVDTGKTFTLPKQTTIVVTLISCGPCGYHWGLKPLNTSVVRRVSHRYVPHKSPPGVVGAGGKEIWTFRTVGAGRSPVQLAYYPPGRGAKPVKRFIVRINVS